MKLTCLPKPRQHECEQIKIFPQKSQTTKNAQTLGKTGSQSYIPKRSIYTRQASMKMCRLTVGGRDALWGEENREGYKFSWDTGRATAIETQENPDRSAWKLQGRGRECVALRFKDEQNRQSDLLRQLLRGSDLYSIRVEATVCIYMSECVWYTHMAHLLCLQNIM